MANRANKIAGNSMWALASRGIEAISAIVVIPIAARYLGVEDFGIYSFIMAISWMLSSFLILGLPRILARDIAQDRQKASEMVSATLSLIALIAIPILLITFVIALSFNEHAREVTAALISIIGIIFMMCSRIFISVFIAFERMKLSAVIAFTISLSLLVFTTSTVYFNLGFISLFVAFSASNFLGLLIAGFLASKYFSIVPRLKMQLDKIKYILKESLPIFISQLLVQAQQFVGVFILQAMSSYSDVGLFQAPQRILSRMQMLPIAFMIGLLPLFSRLSASEESKDELKTTVLSVCKILLIISLPVSIFGFIFSNDITLLIFGENYLQSSSVLKILIFSINFAFLSTVFESLFIAAKRQRSMVFINVIGLLSASLLCLLLVSSYGYIGASIAYTVSSLVVICAALFFLKDIIGINDILITISRPLLGAAIMGLCFQYFKGINLILLLIMGISVYFAALFIMRTFSLKEIQFMKKAAGIRKPINIV